jgi:hypothetical protein
MAKIKKKIKTITVDADLSFFYDGVPTASKPPLTPVRDSKKGNLPRMLLKKQPMPD